MGIKTVPKAYILDCSLSDDLLRRFRTCHGAVGFRLRRSCFGIVKSSRRSGRSLHVCGYNGISRIIFGKYGDKINLMKFMTGSGILCVICYLLTSMSSSPFTGLVGCIICGFSVGIMWPGTISISSQKFPMEELPCLRCLPWQAIWRQHRAAIVGRVTQNTGNNIRAGMGFGLIFPVTLLIMLFILSRTKNRNCIKKIL